MEVRYSLPPVELNKADIEWLWNELGRFLESGPGQPRSSEITRSVSASTGKWPNDETVEDSDVSRFLRSGRLGHVLSRLELDFYASYERADGNEDPASRQITVNFGWLDWTEVSLTGEADWISSVRGQLDQFVRMRERRVRWQRWSAAAILAAAPASAFLVIGYRFDVSAGRTLGVYWLFVTPALLYGFLRKLFPTTLVVIDERGLRQPWYVQWARELFAGVLVSAISTIVIALLWPV